jgi:3-dehydroquinate synthase
VIDHCLKIKSGVVAQDETEKGIRAHLNLGHTFGHAIEELTEYKRYSHGEAVAIGIICACYLGEELNCFKPKYTTAVIDLMEKLGLEYKVPEDIKTKDIINSFKYDKKVEDGKARFIVPKASIGRVEIMTNVDLDLVKVAIDRNR